MVKNHYSEYLEKASTNVHLFSSVKSAQNIVIKSIIDAFDKQHITVHVVVFICMYFLGVLTLFSELFQILNLDYVHNLIDYVNVVDCFMAQGLPFLKMHNVHPELFEYCYT